MATLTLPDRVPAERTLQRFLTRPAPRSLTFFSLVLPLSLLPPLASLYSLAHYPGLVLPAISPAHRLTATLLIGAATLALEWGLVSMMAAQVLLLGAAPDSAFEARLNPLAAYRFAGLAPAPLWLASLALFTPSLTLLGLSLLLAWALVALLVREGVAGLYQPRTAADARRLGVNLLARGFFAWLVIVAGLLLPLAAMAVLD